MKEQMDSIVREGFDFHINLLGSTSRDPVAGIQASRYFESLKVPSAGARSWGLFWTKNDFYKHARQQGAPRVPNTAQFPLFVKPSKGYTSQMIDENSVCHNERELEDAICRIKQRLCISRVQRTDADGLGDSTAYTDLHGPIGWYKDDVVVQEFIDGEEYTVTVIEMGDSAVALNPCIVKSKRLSRKEHFLTFDLRSDPETRNELVRREDNPLLFQRLQHAALEAFEAGMFRGSHMGCDVDLRVNSEKEVFVISVNPEPMAFLQSGKNPRQMPIIESFPGGHLALVNLFIANHFLRSDIRREWSKVAAAYDEVATEYDDQGQSNSQDEVNFRYMVDKYDFQGTVCDLACGTGFFGRILSENRCRTAQGTGKLVGFDLSPGMADICRKTGLYDQVYISGIQTCLLQYPDPAEVDHIVCFGAVHFLSPEEFSFFLVQCFVIANKSITIAVDEIPDSYNKHLRERGLSHMHSINHLANIEAFGKPRGWRLVGRQRHFSWTSPTTGDDVYSTFFRFERVNGRNVEISRAPEKN
jgi:SAM-dependent methyltransferase